MSLFNVRTVVSNCYLSNSSKMLLMSFSLDPQPEVTVSLMLQAQMNRDINDLPQSHTSKMVSQKSNLEVLSTETLLCPSWSNAFNHFPDMIPFLELVFLNSYFIASLLLMSR